MNPLIGAYKETLQPSTYDYCKQEIEKKDLRGLIPLGRYDAVIKEFEERLHV